MATFKEIIDRAAKELSVADSPTDKQALEKSVIGGLKSLSLRVRNTSGIWSLEKAIQIPDAVFIERKMDEVMHRFLIRKELGNL